MVCMGAGLRGGLDDAPPPLSLFDVGGGREKMKPFGSFLLLLSPLSLVSLVLCY